MLILILAEKIDKHFNSMVHAKSIDILKLKEKNVLPEHIYNQNINLEAATRKLFSISYFIAINNRPLEDFQRIVNLIKTFNVDLGSSLHESKTYKRMIETIANYFRQKISAKLNSAGKFTIILDESDTIGNEPALIVYLKTTLSKKPVTFFIDLVKLEEKDSDSVFKSTINSLNNFGISKEK